MARRQLDPEDAAATLVTSNFLRGRGRERMSPEERMALEEFGEIYRHYMESTPAWIPKFKINEPETV